MIKFFANTLVFLILLIIFSFPSCQQSQPDKPNIIIIFTDDQGYSDIGCFGAKGFSTPILDNMAKEGMRFTSFYSASPVCSPSRAALLTGCYPVRVGVPRVLGPFSQTGLNPDEITLAEILREQGYTTACIGKWHLGDHPDFMPLNQGFDEYFGLPYSNDMWPWRDRYKRDGEKITWQPDLPLYDGKEVIELNPDQNQLTTRYTKRAIAFIEKNKNKPFFLYLPHSMPHVPLGVSEKFSGKSVYGRYGDVIEEIDWSVGQILGTLDKYDLDQNTLVIFTSDNGPWLSYGNHAGTANPLREGKGTTFEGGMRIPCIMRWTGKIPADTVCSDLATTMDLLPTIANLAGGQAPIDRIIDGKDIWSLMSGNPEAKSPYEVFFYHFPEEIQAIRSGPWKLHFPHPYRHQNGPGGEDGQKKGETTEIVALSLYNLDSDIGETTNLADDHPEIVTRMQRLADVHLEELTQNARSSAEITEKMLLRYDKLLAQGKYLTNWWLLGPLDNTDRKGLQTVYPPEKEFITTKAYIGRNKKKIKWQQYESKTEYVNFTKIFKDSDEGVAYARRIIEVSDDTTLKIGVGSNDGVRMWVNRILVLDQQVGRTAVPNQDIIVVPFKKGKNTILLKIDQHGGGWGFYFSILEGDE